MMSAGCETQIISEFREPARVVRNTKFIINLDQTMYKIYMISIQKPRKKNRELQYVDRDFQNKKKHFIENLKLR